MRLRADVAPSHLYVPELGPSDSIVSLSRDESHYLHRVCRARIGDVATATDGRGALARLRVIEIGPAARLQVESVEAREPARISWIWCGAPEGQRADWLVEKLAEIGVAVWQPLQCERAE